MTKLYLFKGVLYISAGFTLIALRLASPLWGPPWFFWLHMPVHLALIALGVSYLVKFASKLRP